MSGRPDFLDGPDGTVLASCRVSAKALLCGEYSLLLPGGTGLACSLDRGVTVRVVTGDPGYRVLPLGQWTECALAGSGGTLGAIVRWLSWLALSWEQDGVFRKALVAGSAEPGVTSLEAVGGPSSMPDLAPVGKGFGRGVGVELDLSGWEVPPTGISAMLAAGLGRSLQTLLFPRPGDLATERLAMLAHGLAQGGGSGYDVAVCCRSRSLLFSSPLAPVPWRQTGGGLYRPDSLGWPVCQEVDRLGTWVVVGESGERSETKRMITDMFLSARSEPELWAAHAEASRRLALGICAPDPSHEEIAERVSQANGTLRALEAAAGVEVFTPGLSKLLDAANAVGVPARPSGAGGGDWVVAMGTSEELLGALLDAWKGRVISVIRRGVADGQRL